MKIRRSLNKINYKVYSIGTKNKFNGYIVHKSNNYVCKDKKTADSTVDWHRNETDMIHQDVTTRW